MIYGYEVKLKGESGGHRGVVSSDTMDMAISEIEEYYNNKEVITAVLTVLNKDFNWDVFEIDIEKEDKAIKSFNEPTSVIFQAKADVNTMSETNDLEEILQKLGKLS